MAIGIKNEILAVADAVAREKRLDREEVLMALEVAIQKASRAKYGHDRDVRTKIDRTTGEVSMFAYREVVEEVENEASQINLADAKRLNPQIELGEFIISDLPPFDFGRVAAQTAKQIILQQVRDAERRQQFEEFKNRVGEIVSGVVKRIEFGNVVVDLGQTEAVIQRNQMIPREITRVGERIRAYIADVNPEARGSQIVLSRIHPQFLAKLFTQEVPEIYEGQIQIKSVARDPGSRAKFAVYSSDRGLDPVGACVGMRGTRVQAVVAELQGEKVDIVPWSENPAVFIVNAMVPAEVSKVVLDEDTGRVEVIVPDEQLSLAIGRRGQNVRLASQLTGWSLDVMSETQESERRTAEINQLSSNLIQALDIDEVIAHLLISEGFRRVEEIALVPLEDLNAIEGFEDDLSQELQNRARTYLEVQQTRKQTLAKDLGLQEELVFFDDFTDQTLKAFAENKIKSLDGLADLAGDELAELCPAYTVAQANALIMKARAHWFPEDTEVTEESAE